MAKYAEELFTVTDSATKTYTFTKTYRSETTIKVYLRTPPGNFSETNLFTLSGSEGALDMTLISTAASGLQVGDIIKIAREEDLAKANRPVTFQAGSLSSTDLNDAMEHVLNGVQEISDTVQDTIGLDGTDTDWDADNKKIINVTYPEDDQDAATKIFVQDQVLASGNLPDPKSASNDDILTVASRAWTIVSAASSPFLEKTGNLSDLDDNPTARTNLGLGSASTLDYGTASGEVPVLDSNGEVSVDVMNPAIPSAFANVLVYNQSNGYDQTTNASQDLVANGASPTTSKLGLRDGIAYQTRVVQPTGSSYIEVVDYTDADPQNASSVLLAEGTYVLDADLTFRNSSTTSTDFASVQTFLKAYTPSTETEIASIDAGSTIIVPNELSWSASASLGPFPTAKLLGTYDVPSGGAIIQLVVICTETGATTTSTVHLHDAKFKITRLSV